MAIEDKLYPIVSGLANQRVYPYRLPEKSPLPAIVFLYMAGAPLQAQNTLKRHPRCQLDVWANTYDDVVSTAALVRSTLDHYNDGDFSALLVDERDFPDPATGLFRRIMEFDLWGD